MPKNPLKFARRKSSGNVLDEISEPVAPAVPGTSSFRVLERPEKRINLNGSYPAQKKVTRPFQSPLQQLRGRSAEELGLTVNRSVERERVGSNWVLKQSRGSGGTTNSGSSGYNDSLSASARHSSSSTLPSSVDAEREPSDEELYPRKSKTTPMLKNIIEDLPPPRPSFTARAARALSFGQNHDREQHTVIKNVPLPPLPVNSGSGPGRPGRSESPPQRERAMTTSSYASTAKPEVPLSLGNTDFGSDFASMFEAPKSASSIEPPPKSPLRTNFHRTVGGNANGENYDSDRQQDSEPLYPPRTHSRQAYKLSQEDLANLRDDTSSPYSLDRRGSNEGLMSGSAMSSPRVDEFGAPPVPPHRNGIAQAFLGPGKGAYAAVPDRHSPNLERSSYDSDSGWDGKRDVGYDTKLRKSYEDDPWVKKFELRDPQGSSQSSASESRSTTMTRKPLPASNAAPMTRKPLGMPSEAVSGASRSGALSPDDSEDERPLWSPTSTNATPKAAKLNVDKEELFDSSPVGPPSRAIKAQHMRTDSGTPKKMTKAQFDRLQRNQTSSANQSDEEPNSADEYDVEDEVDHAKRIQKQRRKQEANMSVYRQQMKKVTGGGPTDLPSMSRPSLDRAANSAPSGLLHMGGVGGQQPPESVRGKQAEDDDEDVPLGILQAHGFPGAGRPPTRQGDNDLAGQRRASTSGSVVGGGAGQGNLPPFARRLPADPYFGSSVINPSHRESLGMNGSASVYGAPPSGMPMIPPQQPQGGHPGGLVGVIASEERAKAARRGSPNPATGTFHAPGPAPMPTMGMGGRTMTMPNMMSPQTYMPSGNPMMPPMPMMPGMQMSMMQNPQQDQMQKFMEMQMQLMQNMLSMQQQQLGQTPPPHTPTPDYLGVAMPGNRTSMASNPGYPPSIQSQAPMQNQGRAMTMMNPPPNWSASPGAQRPNSAMPATYAPSGLNIAGAGPGAGYTPSIAPSERSNIGQPSRYRPVQNGGDNAGRSMSMTSSATLLAFRNNEVAPPMPMMSSGPQSSQQSKPTLRMVDKPKGAPRVTRKPVPADEDEDEGWADMRKKRDAKKKFKFGRSKTESAALSDLYQSFD